MGGCCEERYQFPAEGIVTLTEDDRPPPALRPTRANIEREFRRLADRSREGDQVVILLAGHGSPGAGESTRPDQPRARRLERDLPAGRREPVEGDAGARAQRDRGRRSRSLAARDHREAGLCLGDLRLLPFRYDDRGTEVVRELPPESLVPQAELAKARERAARRQERTRGGPATEPAPFVASSRLSTW